MLDLAQTWINVDATWYLRHELSHEPIADPSTDLDWPYIAVLIIWVIPGLGFPALSPFTLLTPELNPVFTDMHYAGLWIEVSCAEPCVERFFNAWAKPCVEPPVDSWAEPSVEPCIEPFADPMLVVCIGPFDKHYVDALAEPCADLSLTQCLNLQLPSW